MNREEAIEVYNGLLNQKIKEAFEFFAPELRESEDERIRKWLSDILDTVNWRNDWPYTKQQVINYLEKQKEPENISASTVFPSCWAEEPSLQKEQKARRMERYQELIFKDICKHLEVEGYSGWVVFLNALRNGEFQPKQEWSEDIIQKAVKEVGLTQHQIDWFKTNVFPPKQEWSEEEYGRLFDIEHYLDGTLQLSPDRKIACIAFLKSLHERFNFKKRNKEMNLDTKLQDRLEEISRNGLENAHTIDFSKEYENSKQILEKSSNSTEWSEEDEKMRQSIIKDIEFDRNYTLATTGKVCEKYNEQINWLKILSLNRKKINEGVEKLCSNEWSEEDERNIRNLESVLYYAKDLPDETRTELGNFLKSLRPQQNHAWSEEDEMETINVFRPLAGTSIESAAKQAVNKFTNSGKKFLLAFNGVFILIDNTKSVQDIVSEYNRSLGGKKKEQEQSEGEPNDFEITLNDCMLAAQQYPPGKIGWDDVKMWAEELSNYCPQPNQKWSEFDRDCLERAIWYIENPAPNVIKDTNLVLWLKSLPLNLKKKNEDVAKLCSNEWSEEDEEMLVRLLDSISIGNDYKEMRNWLLPKLKSLRPQPKVELSEDVKKTLDEVSHILVGLNYKKIAKDYKQAVEKLLSLRPSWKPSEEHFQALRRAIIKADKGSDAETWLIDLYEQLEKLM